MRCHLSRTVSVSYLAFVRYDRKFECTVFAFFTLSAAHLRGKSSDDDDDVVNQQPLVRLTQTRSQTLC